MPAATFPHLTFTMTRTGSDARPDVQDRAEGYMDALRANARTLSIAVLALVAVGVSVFLYMRWSEGKSQRAEQALVRAEQSLMAGNLPLAQTDLQRVVKVYAGTPSANQAALLLAQAQYEQGKFQDGVNALEKYLAANSGSPMDAASEALIAAGYEELNKPAEAAKHYRRAADLTRFPAEKASNLADAARTLTDAGAKADAAAIWAQLAADRNGPAAAEARVRLGELYGLGVTPPADVKVAVTR
ncbi:MAG: hypothetical protein NVS1B4_14770 [Gemmatimonadaceae bacterium]